MENKNGSENSKKVGTIIKNSGITLGTVLAICIIIFVSILAYNAIAFHEGMVIGKTIIVSDNWLVYEDDSFIANSGGQSGKHFDEVYCELHQGSYVKASKGNLYRISYDKKITVKESSKKTYFLIGGYYIASPDTVKSSDEPIKLPEE